MNTFFCAVRVAIAVLLLAPSAVAQQAPRPSASQSNSSATSVPQQQSLTLQDAEKIAIQNHPLVQGAANLAAAAKAQVSEVRSSYYPTVYGSATGVDAENNSRIAAGALNNPIIYERYANGITISQMITDFGRTHELSKSANLHAQEAQENVVKTRADVILAVDEAYYGVLKAQSVLTVAQETVKARQLVSDQTTALQQNQIKSGLDVSFANVQLSQAKLLLLQAQNGLDESQAQLSAALGYGDQRMFQLQEEPLPNSPPGDFPDLLQQAIANRPELVGMRFDVASAQAYARAERDLYMPTLSAAGSAGLTPFGATQLAPRYAAAGFNLNIPIFNGHLFGSLATEAKEKAQAEDENLRNEQNIVVRDVRTAWLNANAAFQRLALTNQLLDQANQSADLAQSRYNLGLSSIVELTQAQLAQTEAQIEQASAKYDYQASLSGLNYETGALH